MIFKHEHNMWDNDASKRLDCAKTIKPDNLSFVLIHLQDVVGPILNVLLCTQT